MIVNDEIDRMMKEQVTYFEQRYDAMTEAYERAIEASLQVQQRKLSDAHPIPAPLLRRVQMACGQTLVRVGNRLLNDAWARPQIVILADADSNSVEPKWCAPQYSVVSVVPDLEEEEQDDQPYQ